MTNPKAVTSTHSEIPPTPLPREKQLTMQTTQRASNLRGRGTGGSLKGLRAAAAVLMTAGSLCLIVAGTAEASTVGATATIATPGSLTPLASGGSATVFTVTLPANAACTADTATGGYHVYSYLVPKGTTLSGLTFVSGPPSGDFGFVDNTGAYYGSVNTAIGTGQIVGIPNSFQWAPLVTIDNVPVATLTTGSTAGVWEAGLLCANSSGAVTDSWNTEVTFVSSASDAAGFTWSAVPGLVTTTTTTTVAGSSTTTTAAGATTTTTGSTSTDPSTTTTAVGAVVAGSSSDGGGSSATGSGSGTGSTGTSGGNLAFTGFPTWKGVGLGLLGIGVGLMLLGWGYRHRRHAQRAVPPSPW
jgi:hypothetical protein